MFPHTDEIVEMFPHTGDIHNGVSGYVEVAVLLERVSNRKAAFYVKLNVKADIMKFGCSGGQQSRRYASCTTKRKISFQCLMSQRMEII